MKRLHFKIFSQRVSVYVTKNENRFIELFNMFNFDKNFLQIKFLDSNNEDLKENLKESKYAVIKNDYHLINLKQIVNDFNLDYFDPNISFCNSMYQIKLP